MSAAKLLLIPNAFTDTQAIDPIMPVEYLKKQVSQVHVWALESRKSGFRFIAKLKEQALKEVPFIELNEHTKEDDLKELKEHLKQGKTVGVIADAGLPCLADPGSNLVLFCHQNGIKVEAIVGPSSIPLAVALSGLSGQRFHFEGYLPKNEVERKERVAELVQRAEKERTTMVFIETPYRNQQIFSLLNEMVPKKAFISVACDLTLPEEAVYTAHPKQFKIDPAILQDRPAIFLFGFH
jgi:16S rRNA (cytidine1402-2'-O)-methyltransferase